MRNARYLLALLTLTSLLAGCARKAAAPGDESPPEAAAPAQAPTAPAAAAPVAAAPGYEEEDLAKLPPLESIADEGQKLLETARRALIQGRAHLEEQQHALVAEDVDVALAALERAQAVLPPASDALTRSGAVQARLRREIPGTKPDFDGLISELAAARGPLAAVPSAAPMPGESLGPTPEPAPAPPTQL